MKHVYYILFFLLLMVSQKLFSQDKLIFKNGSVLKCKLIAISENTITYKDTVEDAPAHTVPKSELLIAEYKSSAIYVFGNGKNNQFQVVTNSMESREQRKERKLKEWKALEPTLSNNILGFYIPELLFGRLTISYERLFANKSMGITIPASLTYNPFGFMSDTSNTNNNGSLGQQRGVNFIGGLDVNYYHDLKPELKYFFGPRIRYGTDMMLGGLEGLSAQLQNGIFRSRGKRFTSTIAIGFGFFKLSEKYARYPGYEPKQVYPWGSFTWRMGFRL